MEGGSRTMEVLNDKNKGKMYKDWGNCKISSSNTEHVATLRSEEEHRAPGTEWNSCKVGFLTCVVHFAVTVWTEKHANEPVWHCFFFWSRLSPGTGFTLSHEII